MNRTNEADRKTSVCSALPLLAVAGLLLFALFAPRASAMSFNVATISQRLATLSGISCPNASFCVAVGSNNTVATSTDPTGGTSAWHATVIGEAELWEAGEKGFFNGWALKGVSCAGPSLCVAVGWYGVIYTSTDPTGTAADWSAVDLSPTGPNLHIAGVSCPDQGLCVAVANGGKVVTSTNPRGGAGAWTTTELEGGLNLRGVSCSSESFCVAVGQGGSIVASTNPTGGASAWQLAGVPSGVGNLNGVSCPTTTLCVTGNATGNVVTSTNPTLGSSAWKTVDGGGSVPIMGASCPAVTECAAVDNNADILTSTDPSGEAGDWSFTNLLPFTDSDGSPNTNGTFGISCPSPELCAISGRGQVVLVSEPFNASSTTAAQPRHRKPKKPKRPKAMIALSPGPWHVAHSAPAKVSFRFFANGKVRGFRCKLDRRRFKPCHSPETYRVGYGRHDFRVRAIGTTGLLGPPAIAHFMIVRPGEVPPTSH